ncbi:hypothetical protein [Bacillus sp. MUM 13]|uniref:hypothetical protein n=1 Tax=Bacillus sp. MUM 13 TaxID=1678001 RepID=UPI0008F5F445|nr:hypothetical protein [Bacillus sp. MUM 13]OIK10040.1 hypothetical protein BIV59_15305 [Bacillus sp. MUM 13]
MNIKYYILMSIVCLINASRYLDNIMHQDAGWYERLMLAAMILAAAVFAAQAYKGWKYKNKH